MPWLCLKCDSRCDFSLVVKGHLVCPDHGIIPQKEAYKVPKRFFAQESKEVRMAKARSKRKKLNYIKRESRRRNR